ARLERQGQERGEGARAVEALLRALALAEPEGYVRLFVDEGTPIARLLQEACRAADARLAAYARRLLAACSEPGQGRRDSALPEPLSEREMQILRLIAAGMTYQEMARELIVAVSTVQHYVRSLYPKLGVHSGLEAVARARDLGLLP
ncbi:MAG: LuxR C-terminal-related transcriptional regulator, partial [Anaerolineae bacterium]|nr:LuxR C-terminal-related transcriptional regulator [Anaerolineae bacterium]